jgi:hypothetical protein
MMMKHGPLRHVFFTMKTLILMTLTAVAVVFAGCATYPSDRIAAHQAEFNSWPPDVQQRVRAGLVAPGFTFEQVFVALGPPRIKTQAGPPGNVSDVWVYHRRAARLSLAIGGASFGRGSAIGGGVAMNGLKLGQDVDGEVVFTNGRVTDVHIYTR